MPSYLNKSSASCSCVSVLKVEALHLLLVLCVFDACSIAVFAAIADVFAASFAVIFCIFCFFLSLFLLDNSPLSAISWRRPLRSISILLGSPLVASLFWILLLLLLKLVAGCRPLISIDMIVTFGPSCCAHLLFGFIFYVFISKLYFNSFLQRYFQQGTSIMIFSYSIYFVFSAGYLFGNILESETSSNFTSSMNNSSLSDNYDEEACNDPWELVLDFFLFLTFIINLYWVNAKLNWDIQLFYIFELCSFQKLQNTAEAMELFSDAEGMDVQLKPPPCSLKRFDFDGIRAEAAGQRCSPPKFLAEEERTLLQSDKVHVRALRSLPYLAYGMIFADKNDILEVSGASHSKLWWKARLLQRAGDKKEKVYEGGVLGVVNKKFIPSQIKLCHILFGAGGATCCLDCFPTPVPPSTTLKMWSILNECIYRRKPWPERLGGVDLQRHEYFRQTYEFVERREGFRRRSLVLLGDHQLMTPIAQALEKQTDSSFVAGFQVPEQKEGISFWKKNLEKEKEKLSKAIRLVINNDQIPVITTATAVDEDLRNSEFAPLVVFIGWLKMRKNLRIPCKECDLSFDAELESAEPEAAADELRRHWDDVHQGHHWIPTRWVPAEPFTAPGGASLMSADM